MNPALQKTIVFLLLILAGYLLQKKINAKQELKGIKVLILSVILPATIFVALLKIDIAPELLLLPFAALAFNLSMFALARVALPYLGYVRGTKEWRTMAMLVGSLAPGLSCFPFVMEYLGDEALAMAALSDVGNKVFVLVILYLIAMNWYYRSRNQEEVAAVGKSDKLKDLGVSLLKEPVNMVIVVAVAMLCFGFDITALPGFLQTTATRLAALMTPVVLLFIGMAVRFERQEMVMILRVLAFRAGVALLLSGLAMAFLPPLAPAMAVLLVIFPQSAISFWPFAHMSAIEDMRKPGESAVFNTGLGLNVLACSLPFSTVIILSVLSCGEYFANPLPVSLLGFALLIPPTAYVLGRQFNLGGAKELLPHEQG